MGDTQIKKITIVGGGTAGWMAAALFSHVLREWPLQIVLVESEDIGVVGVGEATVPIIRAFNKLLGIDEREFLRETKGTFKLGIEFSDWGWKGNRYFHAFGDFGDQIYGIKPHHYWYRLQDALGGSLVDLSFAIEACKQNKFLRPPENVRLKNIAAYNYAYHFDASLYARYLRQFAEKKGVRRVNECVADVVLDAVTGEINRLLLKNGEEIEADFFIDCSGFSGLLIKRALGVIYESWSEWLFCDKAVAVGCQLNHTLPPYTRSIADQAGWQWRIPLQHRVGNGYVYSSQFLDDEKAAADLLASLEGKAISEPLFLRFLPGRCREFWVKNCLAVGLAAGFLEPLESTSIQLIQTSLMRFLEFFPGKVINPILIQEYNRLTANEYERIRDFIIAHYCFGRRPEPMWAQCRAMSLPDSLQHKLEIFSATAKIPMLSEESYVESSWLSVLAGLGVIPNRYDPMANLPAESVVMDVFKQRRKNLQALVSSMPTHSQFLHEYCG